MNKAIIRKIIRLRFRRLKKYYSRFGKKMGIEDIHHFRVELKKLRAFLRMLQSGSDNPVKIPSSLKKVYRHAGLVRELQLHQQTIKQNEDKFPVTHPGHINKRMGDAIKKLRNGMHGALLRDARKKIINKLPATVPPSAIHDFYNQKLAVIRDIISQKDISDTQLHTFRKNLKDILYAAGSFETDLSCPFPVDGWNEEKRTYFSELADELGKFRDTCNELAQLEKTHHKSKEEKKAIMELHLHQLQQKKDIGGSLKKKYTGTHYFFP